MQSARLYLRTMSFAVFVSMTMPGSLAVTITPSQATVSESTTQQFTSSLASTWATDCGTISSTGLFKAPLYPKVCKITATATNGSGSATASANVVSPITMTPVSAGTVQGMTQQFTSSMPVKWSAKCGTISASGLFTASATVGSKCTIEGIASAGTPYTVYGYDSILPPSSFSITPLAPHLTEGATQQFAASSPATWMASCGTISSSGLYTAPLAAESCSISATDGSGHTASTTATITAVTSLTVTPAAAEVHVLGTKQFTANAPVTWSTSCGSIGATTGSFKAPTSAAACVVTATDSTGNTAQSMVTVDVVNYLSWKGGESNVGVQSHETSLTPLNVNSTHFGLKWTTAVDGSVAAQPLYMNGLTVNGVVRNVVFVATSNDSIYALDGDSGAVLWKKSFLSTGVTAVSGRSVNSPTAQIGVLGTPVIDASTGTLYAAAETAERNTTYFPHRLHAIDVTNGHEKFNGPVLISDVNLPPVHKMQRPGLVLANGMVYVSLGSISDRSPYHGFVFAFDQQTLAQKHVWNSTRTGGQGGLWMSAGAPAVDASGNLYVTTGNGSFDGSSNFGQASIKLSPTLAVVDYFAPYNYTTQNSHDVDLGSTTIAILPDQPGRYPHELVLCGKPPYIYVLNGDAMGHAGKSSDNIIQRVDFGVGSSDNCFATPTYWNSNLYIVGGREPLKMYTLNSSTGLLTSSAVAQGRYTYGGLGAQPVVSSSGTSNGIVWSIEPYSGQIFANDASNIAKQLYSATITGGVNHFVVPTVVNGHVYVGGQHEIVAYSSK